MMELQIEDKLHWKSEFNQEIISNVRWFKWKTLKLQFLNDENKFLVEVGLRVLFHFKWVSGVHRGDNKNIKLIPVKWSSSIV